MLQMSPVLYKTSVFIAALAILSTGIYGFSFLERKSPDVVASVESSDKTIGPAGLMIRAGRPIVPEFSFSDEAGKVHQISDFKGRVLLVNFWASWCFPCRQEMPAIVTLQQAMPADRFGVLTISLDRKGAATAKPTLEELGAENLNNYFDLGSKALSAIGETGLPVSLLIDAEGREIGRALGGHDWGSAEMQSYFRKLMKD